MPLPSPDAPKPVQQPKVKPPKPPKEKPRPPKQPPKETARRPIQNKAFSNLLNDLSSKPSTEPPKLNARDTGADTPNISDALSLSEMDAVRAQVMSCWLEPTGLKEGEKLIVEIRVQVNRDRTVYNAEIVDKARMRRDPFYRTLGESAIRALYNPRCSPLLLPPEKYNTWKDITFRFTPGEIY
jgi:hypothetical protein